MNKWASVCVVWRLTSALCICFLIDNGWEPIRYEDSGFIVAKKKNIFEYWKHLGFWQGMEFGCWVISSRCFICTYCLCSPVLQGEETEDTEHEDPDSDLPNVSAINLTLLLPCFSVQIKQKCFKNMNSVQQQHEVHHH